MGPVPIILPCKTLLIDGNQGASSGNSSFSSYSQFYAASPPAHITDTVIDHDVTYTNICPGGVETDPLDPDGIVFFVGEFPGNTRVNSRVALYTAPKSDILNMTRVGVVLEKHVNSSFFDQNGAAFGSIVNLGNGTYYYYYCGQQGTSGNGTQNVCLATSTDCRTWTKQGRVIAPDGVNEFNLTDPVIKLWDGVFYCYVTAKASGGSLPIGIVIYSSNDGISWTRIGRAVDLGAARTYDALYIEGCDIMKFGNDYVMLYTTAAQSNIWSCGVARASSPTQLNWTKEPITYLQHQGTGFAKNSIAVPLYFENGPDKYIFYQGTQQFQPADTWDIGVAQFNNSPEVFPIGFLEGRGWWVGQAFFDTQSDIAVGTGSRSARALDNTGVSTVLVDYTVDITPGTNSSFRATIRASVGTGAFRGGFYLMEGSNQCTGIYFNGGNISHLRSVGWSTLQAYSANTNYIIEVTVTSNSTYTIKVNGVQSGGSNALFTNVTTKINKIRLEKAQQSTALIYYGDMIAKNNNVDTALNIGQ